MYLLLDPSLWVLLVFSARALSLYFVALHWRAMNWYLQDKLLRVYFFFKKTNSYNDSCMANTYHCGHNLTQNDVFIAKVKLS